MPSLIHSLCTGRPFRLARTALLLCLLYLVADIALTRFAARNSWMILWPLNGVTIAILLKRPRAEWPSLLLGIALGKGISTYSQGLPLSVTVLNRLLSITEVVLCACILPRFTQLDRWLRSPRLPLRFCAALLLGPGITGLLYATLARASNHLTFLGALNAWATADALGIAATLPLALALRSPQMRALFVPRALPKTLGVLTIAWSVPVLIFRVEHPPLLFLLYPALLAVDLILGFAGASIGAFGVCLISVYTSIRNPAPITAWAAGIGTRSHVTLQAYLGFHLLALLPASIVLLERRRVAAQLIEANAQLKLLAALDGLTGIANRRTFDECLAREWSAAIRQRTETALLMIDIDRFKPYNDHYGHLGGDACLRTVASLIATIAERPQDLSARYGGEEFAALLPATTLEGAYRQAERLRAAVFDQAMEHCGSPLGRVTLSIGIAAMIPSVGDPSTLLVELADEALYQAKQSGRNTVRQFSMKDRFPIVNQVRRLTLPSRVRE